MILLDTDILSLLLMANEKVRRSYEECKEIIATTIITRIEVHSGRFASLLKVADAGELQRAVQRLQVAEQDLSEFLLVSVNEAASLEFEKLLLIKKLKKIRRPDLLIAAITLANKATLATRNEKHFKLIPGLRIDNWAK